MALLEFTQMAPILEPCQHPIARLHRSADLPHAEPNAGETSTAIHITSDMDTTDIDDEDHGAGSYVTVIDIG